MTSKIFLIVIVTAALAGPVFAQQEHARYEPVRAPKYHQPQKQQPPYPSYLPWGSCQDLWYTVPGYRSPMDCND